MNAPVKLRPEAAEMPSPLALLRAPFPDHQVSKLPKPTKAQTDAVVADFKKGVRCQVCGSWHHPDVIHLDYVGHAALTDRLLDADPQWSWEPVAFRDGLPAFDQTGGLWIRLTVCGVTRLGYGHAAAKQKADPGAREKEVIGDALRNAAMRFGAALDLWHKGDLHVPDTEQDDKPAPAASPPRQQTTAPNTTQGAEVPQTPSLAVRANRLESALRAQKSKADLIKAYKLGSGLCAELDLKDPERLAEIETLYSTLLTAFEVPDLGIGDDEIPY